MSAITLLNFIFSVFRNMRQKRLIEGMKNGNKIPDSNNVVTSGTNDATKKISKTKDAEVKLFHTDEALMEIFDANMDDPEMYNLTFE